MCCRKQSDAGRNAGLRKAGIKGGAELVSPGGAARPQLGVAQILAQDQQTFRIGIDGTVLPGEPHEKFDCPLGCPRNRTGEARGISVQPIPGNQE